MYQLDLANGTHLHKAGKGLSQEAIKQIKPIFTDLADDSLLSKCLHGKTQNQNESFDGLIWRRTPKDRFVKLTTFGFAVYDAVTHFNIGNLASLILYDKVNIERGYYTPLGCISDNETRISNSVRQSSNKQKTRRRYLRGKKKVGDKLKNVEGKMYSVGSF